jgi:hypothetical protein
MAGNWPATTPRLILARGTTSTTHGNILSKLVRGLAALIPLDSGLFFSFTGSVLVLRAKYDNASTARNTKATLGIQIGYKDSATWTKQIAPSLMQMQLSLWVSMQYPCRVVCYARPFFNGMVTQMHRKHRSSEV